MSSHVLRHGPSCLEPWSRARCRDPVSRSAHLTGTRAAVAPRRALALPPPPSVTAKCYHAPTAVPCQAAGTGRAIHGLNFLGACTGGFPQAPPPVSCSSSAVERPSWSLLDSFKAPDLDISERIRWNLASTRRASSRESSC
ncbi:hypothetical protein MTO96_034939 [Rhipicephalus appendiculatus]